MVFSRTRRKLIKNGFHFLGNMRSLLHEQKPMKEIALFLTEQKVDWFVSFLPCYSVCDGSEIKEFFFSLYGIEWQVTEGIRNNTTKRKMVVTIFFCVTSPDPFDFLCWCFSIKPSGNKTEEIWRTNFFFHLIRLDCIR